MRYIDGNQMQALGEIADELGDLARTAAASNADPFQLRQILRFIGQVIQIVDQSFETVYGLLIELRYLSEKDVSEGRHIALCKELDLLLAKSHYRNALEICSRLRHLRELYDTAVAPIVQDQGLDPAGWHTVLQLIDEYEGAIVGVIGKTVDDLRALLNGPMPSSLTDLRNLSAERADMLRRALVRLRDLNSRILGLSGHEGLLELTETNRGSLAQVFISQNFDQRYSDQRRGAFMGDIFSNIQHSTIVNRSLVEGAFNRVKAQTDEETAEVLRNVSEAVARSGNKEAGEILDQFNEEITKPEPRKSLLKRSWDNLVQVLPAVTTVAGAAGAIAKLFT
jgi:hypothetical protein